MSSDLRKEFSDDQAKKLLLILLCNELFKKYKKSEYEFSKLDKLLDARCLTITEKVSFNIASEASYVYILSGQKLIKNAKNGQFGEFLKT